MIITRDKIVSHYETNADYNQAVGPLVGEIFQTESHGPVSYIPVPRFQPHSPWMSATAATVKVVEKRYAAAIEEVQRFDMSGLEQYESTLFSCLAWGQYSTYVVAGEMGSGKSSCANFLMQALKRPRLKTCGMCLRCTPMLVTIDFNKGFDFVDKNLVMKTFREILYAELKPRLRNIFEAEKLTPKFVEFCKSDGITLGFNLFDDFIQATRRSKVWHSLSNTEQAEHLIDFVNDKHDIHQQLWLSMLLLNYVRRTSRQDNPCLVLLFDNLDRVLADAQLDILVTILSLQDISQTKALVTLRKTTFERLASQAAYSFGYINHTGPRPLDIIRSRIQYWLAHWDEMPQVLSIPEEYRNALFARLQYCLDLYEHSPRTIESIEAIAGSSVRLGLYMMERVFVNSSIRYNEAPHYTSDVLRAVIVNADSPNLEVSATDQVLANVFAAPRSTQRSFILLRILQLVFAFKDFPTERKTSNLELFLRTIGGWKPEEVREALNHLLYVKRPLLWVDGKTAYRDVQDMRQCNDVVYLTDAGEAYIRKLIKDLVYVQECLMSVSWADERIPPRVDYSRMTERLTVLRQCIRVLMEDDWKQTRQFRAWLKTNSRFHNISPVMMTGRIAYSVGRAAQGILKTGRSQTPAEVSCLSGWKSTLIEAYNKEREILGVENTKLMSLIESFDA